MLKAIGNTTGDHYALRRNVGNLAGSKKFLAFNV
jgi:hypothetical protein